MKIAHMTKTETGIFEGRIETLTFGAAIKLFPVTDKTNTKAPDYRIVHADGDLEIGAGWNEKSTRTGNPYISVKIDDPSFPHPLWAALTKSEEGEYSLLWTRPKPKTDPESQGETL